MDLALEKACGVQRQQRPESAASGVGSIDERLAWSNSRNLSAWHDGAGGGPAACLASSRRRHADLSTWHDGERGRT